MGADGAHSAARSAHPTLFDSRSAEGACEVAKRQSHEREAASGAAQHQSHPLRQNVNPVSVTSIADVSEASVSQLVGDQ